MLTKRDIKALKMSNRKLATFAFVFVGLFSLFFLVLGCMKFSLASKAISLGNLSLAELFKKLDLSVEYSGYFVFARDQLSVGILSIGLSFMFILMTCTKVMERNRNRRLVKFIEKHESELLETETSSDTKD